MWNMTVSQGSAEAPGAPDTGVGVLDRSIAILDAVERGARSHAAIVRATGLSRTTAHRLIRSLGTHGFLELADGRGYRLGPRLLRLGAAALREPGLRDVAHGALERLAEVTGESAQFFVIGIDARICIDAVQSTSELRTIVPVGSELPITAGSAGKVFLAWMHPTRRDELIDHAVAVTDATPIGDALRDQLIVIRRRGWASSAGEREPGVGSVSAPVIGRHDALVGVVSISGPTGRIGRIPAKRYVPAVLAAAREIEVALGVAS
jgi:DNA-binding IclR family transcriptional regulator